MEGEGAEIIIVKPDAGRSRACAGKRAGRGLRSLVAIAVLCAASACAGPYAGVLKRLDAQPSCCASMAGLPFRQLVFGQRAMVDLTTASPAYLFPSGKSYFAAFMLPPYTGPYRIIIDSYLLGDGSGDAAVFLPVVLTLDGQHNKARFFDERLFQLHLSTPGGTPGPPHRLTGTIEMGEEARGERYLVILTKEELMRSWIVINSPGEEERKRIRTVPVGNLQLRLESIVP
jgi:maltose operon protein